MERPVSSFVVVPHGWQRLVDNGRVTYISPDSITLNSRDEVLRHLTSSGTCKCGLRCPFKIDEAFNFDPTILGLPDNVPFTNQTLCCVKPRLNLHKVKRQPNTKRMPAIRNKSATNKTGGNKTVFKSPKKLKTSTMERNKMPFSLVKSKTSSTSRLVNPVQTSVSLPLINLQALLSAVAVQTTSSTTPTAVNNQNVTSLSLPAGTTHHNNSTSIALPTWLRTALQQGQPNNSNVSIPQILFVADNLAISNSGRPSSAPTNSARASISSSNSSGSNSVINRPSSAPSNSTRQSINSNKSPIGTPIVSTTGDTLLNTSSAITSSTNTSSFITSSVTSQLTFSTSPIQVTSSFTTASVSTSSVSSTVTSSAVTSSFTTSSRVTSSSVTSFTSSSQVTSQVTSSTSSSVTSSSVTSSSVTSSSVTSSSVTSSIVTSSTSPSSPTFASTVTSCAPLSVTPPIISSAIPSLPSTCSTSLIPTTSLISSLISPVSDTTGVSSTIVYSPASNSNNNHTSITNIIPFTVTQTVSNIVPPLTNMSSTSESTSTTSTPSELKVTLFDDPFYEAITGRLHVAIVSQAKPFDEELDGFEKYATSITTFENLQHLPLEQLPEKVLVHDSCDSLTQEDVNNLSSDDNCNKLLRSQLNINNDIINEEHHHGDLSKLQVLAVINEGQETQQEDNTVALSNEAQQQLPVLENIHTATELINRTITNTSESTERNLESTEIKNQVKESNYLSDRTSDTCSEENPQPLLVNSSPLLNDISEEHVHVIQRTTDNNSELLILVDEPLNNGNMNNMTQESLQINNENSSKETREVDNEQVHDEEKAIEAAHNNVVKSKKKAPHKGPGSASYKKRNPFVISRRRKKKSKSQGEKSGGKIKSSKRREEKEEVKHNEKDKEDSITDEAHNVLSMETILYKTKEDREKEEENEKQEGEIQDLLKDNEDRVEDYEDELPSDNSSISGDIYCPSNTMNSECTYYREYNLRRRSSSVVSFTSNVSSTLHPPLESGTKTKGRPVEDKARDSFTSEKRLPTKRRRSPLKRMRSASFSSMNSCSENISKSKKKSEPEESIDLLSTPEDSLASKRRRSVSLCSIDTYALSENISNLKERSLERDSPPPAAIVDKPLSKRKKRGSSLRGDSVSSSVSRYSFRYRKSYEPNDFHDSDSVYREVTSPSDSVFSGPSTLLSVHSYSSLWNDKPEREGEREERGEEGEREEREEGEREGKDKREREGEESEDGEVEDKELNHFSYVNPNYHVPIKTMTYGRKRRRIQEELTPTNNTNTNEQTYDQSITDSQHSTDGAPLIVSISRQSLPYVTRYLTLKCFEKSLSVGDIVWAKAPQLAAWPGKVISHRQWKNELKPPSKEEVWVKWYNSDSVSLVRKVDVSLLDESFKLPKVKLKNKKLCVAMEEALNALR